MSIATISNRWLNRLYKTIAILLVVVAVLISAFRLFLPYAHNYRQALQEYVNEQNTTEIMIGSLNMTWQRFGPRLLVNDVRLIESEQASVFIEQVEVDIDFWRSLVEQRLVSKNLVLTGAKIDIAQGLWQDNWRITSPQSDKPAKSTRNKDNDFDRLANVFLNRLGQFSVRASEINVRHKFLSRTLVINKLDWLNSNNLHQGQGSVVINGLSSNNLHLKVKLAGDHISELTGQLYLQASHLDITPWLDSVLAIENDKTQTDISFSAWLDIRHSIVERMQLQFPENTIKWMVNHDQQSLGLAKGQILMVKDNSAHSTKFYSTPLSVQFNQLPPQEFTVLVNKKLTQYNAYLSGVDLSLVGQVMPLIVSEKESQELLAELSFSGRANEVFIKIEPDDLQLVADLVNVSTGYSHGFPGLSNLSGQLSLNNTELALAIQSQQGRLDFKEHFIAPLPYDTLIVELNLSLAEQGWSLVVDQFDFLSKEIKLSAQLQVEALQGQETHMSLLADISDSKADLAGHFYPLTLMSESLVEYLNTALISGDIEQAQVLVNGPISHFPFTDGSGIFVVDAELTNSTFKFSKDWPEIEHFAANLNFTNNSMLITGRSGSLVGLDVAGVTAEIIDLSGKQVLTVDTNIKPSKARLVSQLMAQSPLENTVGSVLEQLRVTGDISGNFQLQLPLNNTEQAVATGQIEFFNNQLFLQQPQMNFTEVTGQLTFVNDDILTRNVTVNWQGLPIALNVSGHNKKDYYGTDIKLTANWQETEWQQQVPNSLKKYVRGMLAWQGDLSLHQHHQGGFSYNLDIESNLFNTQLHLPSPYAKPLGQDKPFFVNVTGQLQQSKINAQLGEGMSFFGVIDHQSTSFTRAHLVLGNEKMLLPMDGFHITTKLEQADFSQWQPLVSDIIETVSSATTKFDVAEQNNLAYLPLFVKPERIRGTIGQLVFLGQKLNNVSFNLLDKTHWWLLQLNAKETRSQFKFYPDWLTQGVDIEAEFIHLAGQEQENSALQHMAKVIEIPDASTIDDDIVFANIPPIKLHCDRCQLGNFDLGKVDFSIARTNPNLIEITHFKAQRAQGKLNFSGAWFKNAQQSKSSIQGHLAMDDIEYELKQLGFSDSSIRDSGGELDFNIHWQGGPNDFSIKQVSGDFSAALDDGYLADVKDRARILSILSLQSLVRKLTLDFRDMFSDGMFYSSIKGDYQLEQGVLYTKNTKMNGAAGNVFLTGNTDLISKELDYKISYQPNYTANFPALAWITTLDPVTFLAGIALDQVIKSQVVSEFKFEVTGNMLNPVIKEVDRKSQNISVGRNSPPKVIDTPKGSEKSKTKIDPHLQQYQSPIERNKAPENKTGGAATLLMLQQTMPVLNGVANA